MDEVQEKNIAEQQSEVRGEQAGTKEQEQRQESAGSDHTREGNVERKEAKSELFYQKILSKVRTSSQSSDDDDTDAAKFDAKTIMALQDAEAQVSRLVELASHQGVVYAVKVARALDFYVLDQVHDRLSNRFYDALVEKGIIEKE